MDVTGVNAAAAASAGTTTGLGKLDSEAFLKLLVAQLRYQNPLEPTDPSAMLGQTAQFTQVETLQQLAQVSAQLAGLSQSSMAAGMVGKEISSVSADGATVTGRVDAVRFAASGPVLLVGGAEVPLAAVSEVRPGTPAA